ncbi:serine hydrolase domain-containing protein [Streptomyces sviceus]|uniref:serine hydrolase domain-containing protein n=1 Tax=Streptomyces sviceus TaxID=285530 RepID=UPI0036E4D996
MTSNAVMALRGGWVDTLLSAPRLSAPGTQFRYDNGAAHVLAACLVRALGEDLEVYAAHRLFAPLGVTRGWHWPQPPDGVPYGFGHLQLSPLDLLALGAVVGGWYGSGWSAAVHHRVRRRCDPEHSAGSPPECTGYGFLGG